MFYQKGQLSFCARLIPNKVRSLKELGIPEDVYEFADAHQGLFLVVGPNGHGKTTTIASLIDYINQRQERHIVTIEDPVEYIFKSQRSLVEQREVYEDAVDFPSALKASFREDVDVVFVGEMRDLETISTAITAAETGHLIFGTLHTNDAVQTIDRIIDVFPAHQQNQIRYQLSSVLVGVVSQRLLPKIGGGRIPAIEIMKCNNAIANLIRQNQTHQIGVVMETSLDEGMISINRSLATLVSEGSVSLEDAEGFATDTSAFKMFLESM
jgi:twitching motility protein PilT